MPFADLRPRVSTPCRLLLANASVCPRLPYKVAGWLIVQFISSDCLQVTHWAKNEYGKFYNGDSYILLNTYKEKDSEVCACV